ncbi:MAG: hypothetical protein D6732_02585 [Methanobacteriota archaeon]|nr:MAG: hypothetical protein D6732_02585 [Euryarchaeota archaeon]
MSDSTEKGNLPIPPTSNKSKSDEELIPKGKSTSYIHVRVDPQFKEDLMKKVEEEKTNLTAFVVNTLSDAIYKTDEEEEDKEEKLLDEILNSMEKLERRIEIRLSTLQDTFNSLIGRLIDFENRDRQRRKRRKAGDGEKDNEDTISLENENILKLEPEKIIYARVKRYIENRGAANFPEFEEILAHLETDSRIKEYLDQQSANFPGWKESLVTDAIEEAIEELGISVIKKGGEKK